MKKTLILFIFTTFFTLNSFASYDSTTILSDMDDTYKITNTKNPAQAFYNGLFTLRSFSGMSKLYNLMHEDPSKDFFILSNSPNLLNKKIKKLLLVSGAPKATIYTRSLRKDKDKFKYKYNHIVEVLKGTTDNLILVGDDSGEDHEIYAKIMTDFPGRISAAYIRPVRSRKLDSRITKYHTSFDIAYNEVKAKRMDKVDALELADTLLSDDVKPSSFYPSFLPCPSIIDAEAFDPLLYATLVRVRLKALSICKLRK